MRAALLMLCLWCAGVAAAHPSSEATVTYLGNEGLLFAAAGHKVLFDPFYHNDYGIYRLVPAATRADIFAARAPFDGVDLVLISHAHEDHFDAADMQRFLKAHTAVQLIAPAQAVAQIEDLAAIDPGRLHALDPVYGEGPERIELAGLSIEALRIPHAGWPARAEVVNLVYRVQADGGATVMHLGDADPDDAHFAPWHDHWQALRTDLAFPPYWFFLSPDGRAILQQRINATQSIGVHVPVQVPPELTATGADFLQRPGEQRELPLRPRNP